jgi:hypothetical protein
VVSLLISSLNFACCCDFQQVNHPADQQLGNSLKLSPPSQSPSISGGNNAGPLRPANNVAATQQNNTSEPGNSQHDNGAAAATLNDYFSSPGVPRMMHYHASIKESIDIHKAAAQNTIDHFNAAWNGRKE